jgi:hypothetical protein
VDAARDGVRIESSVPEPVRHTDARRLAQSGAGEDDRAVARELVEAGRYLIRRDADCVEELDRIVLVAPHVDEQRVVSE